MTRDKVLLIGNGINNLNSQYKWKDLVGDLIQFVGATRHIEMRDKPFPLLYEEIVAHAVKEEQIKESDIKGFIADRISSFRPNEIHKQIMELGLSNILTTNYDYTLEMAAGVQDPNSLRNGGIIREGVYSLFRAVRIGKIQVWHIHGERNLPQSIALGYEHYGGYLQRMRNYVVLGTGEAYKKSLDSLVKRLKKGALAFDSWIDLFFSRDIHIVGLTLDFIEMHLWWLLTYRARQKYTHRLPIKNKIIYYYPSQWQSILSDKLELLAASDVVPIPVSLKKGDWASYYRRVLGKIRRS